MDVTVKYRDASVCNFKLMLIYLVVLAHLIRPCIDGNEAAYRIYNFIYSFHMPAFAFVSGIFLKSVQSCLKSAKTALIRYLAVQICFSLVCRGNFNVLLPCWGLWYLLALAHWCLIGAGYVYLSSFFTRKKIFAVTVLTICLVLGCVSGLVSGIGKTLSLSRSIVFLPYFLIGITIPKNAKEQGRIKRGITLLTSGLVIYLIFKDAIPVFFTYHASPFGSIGSKGVFLRAVCYAVGILITLGVYYLIPDKRLPITKIGTDTFTIYIFHLPIAGWIRGYSDNGLYFICSFITSAVMIYLLHRIFIFGGNLYAVREKKGGRIRDGTVL